MSPSFRSDTRGVRSEPFPRPAKATGGIDACSDIAGSGMVYERRMKMILNRLKAIKDGLKFEAFCDVSVAIVRSFD
jgi:hypothetical protein